MRPPVGVPLPAPGRRGTWSQTYTGRKFYPLDPRPQDVCIEDIAHQLANVCRYGGATLQFYSVAEHCVIVSQYVPEELAREALLHDAAEAYVGDMTRPLKHQPEMLEFRKAEALIDRAIHNHFGIVSTAETRKAIKAIDDRIIIDESRALMADPDAYLERHPNDLALNATIAALSPTAAEHVFWQRFVELFPEWAW